MTTYQGGKKRLGKRIASVCKAVEFDILNHNNSPYFEPFVGMAGVLNHMSRNESEEKRKSITASDINKDLILMWNKLKKGWKPPKKCSKEKYEKLKECKKHSAERGFIGVVASWGGMFFHAYRLDYKSDRDFMNEGYNGIMKIVPDIKRVSFKNGCYSDYNPTGKLIYCDPPYKDNKLAVNNHAFFQNFDHDQFWNKMREWSKKNIVIISESSAPKDFKKIWSATSSVTINQNSAKKYSDNLYVHKDLYEALSHSTKTSVKKL
jgi:DNA adenine methylase